MVKPWFHLEIVPAGGGVVHLSRQEARHAAGSRRLGPGDLVVVFDGRGSLAEGRISDERDQSGNLEIEIGPAQTLPEPSPRIELCASLPKGDRLATMLDMATQAGMAVFRPLECEWSVRKASGMRSDQGERWQRIFLEACKQSGQAWLPHVASPLDPVTAARSARDQGHLVLAAQQGGVPINEAVPGDVESVTVLIGPEGGFSERELHGLGEAESRFVSLGRSIFRVEAAAAMAVWAIQSAKAQGS
ncbi:MAG: 16S rRNA (uracil(1498)-N(3))-methyltransferase [Phycisphaerales bacterium]|nr:16S rRNA (uracil(1498)-N(3))-methyltransferase [Phycisphaerales bacterium]